MFTFQWNGGKKCNVCEEIEKSKQFSPLVWNLFDRPSVRKLNNLGSVEKAIGRRLVKERSNGTKGRRRVENDSENL